MRSIFQKKVSFLTVSIGQKKIIFSSVSIHSSAFFVLHDMQEFPLPSPCINNLTINNITLLKTIFKKFLRTHKKKTYAIFGLSLPGMYERIISLNIETPQEHHLQQEDSAKKLIWNYLPLGSNNVTGKTHYYMCGITREHLFQYQLLAIAANINCIGIVPQRTALIKASHYFFPEYVTTTSITNHALLQNYVNYCSQQARLEKVLQSYTSIEKKLLFETFGLVLLGRELYEHC